MAKKRATWAIPSRAAKHADTIGVLVDMTTAEKVLECLPNHDLHLLLELSRANKAQYIVAGGQLHMKDSGCYGMAVQSPEDAMHALRMVNERMGDRGSSTTMWCAHTEDKDLQTRAEHYLAEYSHHEGGMQ